MNRKSLMNPAFLKEELADAVRLFNEEQIERTEISANISTALMHIHRLPDGETYTLPKDQMMEIVKAVAAAQMFLYRPSSARAVYVNQITHLSEDWAYKLITRITKIFRR